MHTPLVLLTFTVLNIDSQIIINYK